MCDYSLHAVPNRLGVEGEELVTHRFQTRTMGLASPIELEQSERAKRECQQAQRSWWHAVKSFLELQPELPVTAVCIPPGARLMISDVPAALQKQLGIGEREQVKFTQRSASEYHYRDAIRFHNGRDLLLQELPTGLRVKVLSLDSAEPEPASESQAVLRSE
jgi:hypothetical protein